jgi:hypothetical protein
MNRNCLVAVVMLAVVGPLSARTITLTADDCDQMAVINADAPRASWGTILGAGLYNTHTTVTMASNMAVLMRFPLDKIPKGQRILKAEWTAPYGYTAGVKLKLYVRRLVADWGTGACHDYRMTFPKKLEWSTRGALGANSDRANRASAAFTMENSGEATVDVTEDVDLWYTGGSPNRGWILTLDDGGIVYLTAPYPSGSTWKLQITFEPK